MSRLTRDGTAEPISRDQILKHARGQGNIIFPVQLTTSRIGNLTRLIHTLLYVMTIHTYTHIYIIATTLSEEESSRCRRAGWQGAGLTFIVIPKNCTRYAIFGYIAYTEQGDNHGTMILDGVSHSAIHFGRVILSRIYIMVEPSRSQSSSLTCTLGGTYVSCVFPNNPLLIIIRSLHYLSQDS